MKREKKQNMSISVELIEILYKLGKINTPTYKAIMQKVKAGVYNA